MQNEQDVDDDEQVVRVPERVEAREAVEGPRKLNQTAAEPVSREQEGDDHEHQHDDAAPTDRQTQDIRVRGLPQWEIVTQVL